MAGFPAKLLIKIYIVSMNCVYAHHILKWNKVLILFGVAPLAENGKERHEARLINCRTNVFPQLDSLNMSRQETQNL